MYLIIKNSKLSTFFLQIPTTTTTRTNKKCMVEMNPVPMVQNPVQILNHYNEFEFWNG